MRSSNRTIQVIAILVSVVGAVLIGAILIVWVGVGGEPILVLGVGIRVGTI